MTRPITKPQMDNLWFDEFVSHNGHCMLCGNSGKINTVGRVFTATGVECGGEALCICPNGRTIKRKTR